MILNVLAVIFLVVGAVALALIDKALGPDNRQFPCAHPLMHWAIRLYALAIFNVAVQLAVQMAHGDTRVIAWGWLGFTAALGTTHVVLLWLLLRARIPANVLRRMDRRVASRQVHSL